MGGQCIFWPKECPGNQPNNFSHVPCSLLLQQLSLQHSLEKTLQCSCCSQMLQTCGLVDLNEDGIPCSVSNAHPKNQTNDIRKDGTISCSQWQVQDQPHFQAGLEKTLQCICCCYLISTWESLQCIAMYVMYCVHTVHNSTQHWRPTMQEKSSRAGHWRSCHNLLYMQTLHRS